MKSYLQCVCCAQSYLLLSGVNRCECGGLLEVTHERAYFGGNATRWLALFESRWGAKELPDSSGVWRYREALLPGFPEEMIISRGEGNTRLYDFPRLTERVGVAELQWKHEGENPTGSFKDRGMTTAVSWAKRLGARALVCASTGNTSASAASYGRAAGLPVYVLMSEGDIALGKVSQSLAYGAKVIRLRGNFDAAMKLVESAASELALYVLNSVNPMRLEGQKTIIWELFEQREWRAPNWIVLPGGNLGNTSAFGKALHELMLMGLMRGDEMPRLAVIQAEGANPFYRSFKNHFYDRWVVEANTVATAIKIGDPVNHAKAVRAIKLTNGLVESVTDSEILEAKAMLDREGVGAEPASAATLAGLLKLRSAGIISESDSVVCVLTGHMLKDPDATIRFHTEGESVSANKPVTIDPTIDELKKVL